MTMILLFQWYYKLKFKLKNNMRFSSELIEARLIKKYKRFLADVSFNNGSKKTVYCPNPGSLLGLNVINSKVWLERSQNKKSKYEYIWRLIELRDGTLVCIDTQMANKVIYENLKNGQIPELIEYETIISEPKIDDESRLDFLLKSKNIPACFIEVKSSTLSRFPGISEFPDTITKRGSKHLSILTDLKMNGFRSIQIYLLQRNDTNSFKIAKDIDEIYFRSLKEARKSGVEIMVFQSDVSKSGIKLSKKRLPFL